MNVKCGASGCPVRESKEKVVEHAGNLVAALRRLKREVRACRAGGCLQDCWLLNEFNRQAQAALDQVLEEWGLGNGE